MRPESTVFLIDDDPGMRKSLLMVMEVAGLRAEAFESAEAYLRARRGDEPGCLVLDLRLGGISGLELLEDLRRRNALVPVIMITGHGEVADAVQSMKLGALDFIEKPVNPTDLVVKVQGALDADRQRRARQSEAATLRKRLGQLTPRELELLKLLIEGKSSKVIAGEMGLSQKTVENHRSHLLAKTGALNAADLVRMAMVAGIG